MIRELLENVGVGFSYAFGAFAALETFLMLHGAPVNHVLEVIGFR